MPFQCELFSVVVANVTALCHVLSIFVFWVIVVVVPAVGNVVAVSIILDAVVADSIINCIL